MVALADFAMDGETAVNRIEAKAIHQAKRPKLKTYLLSQIFLYRARLAFCVKRPESANSVAL